MSAFRVGIAAGIGLLMGCSGQVDSGDPAQPSGAGAADGGPGAAGSSGTTPGGNAGGETGNGGTTFPMPDWPTATPEEMGLNRAALEAAADYSESVGGLCMTVIKDGKLVFEDYFNGTDVNTLNKSWSVAKSFTSSIIGIMITRGEIESVDEPAANYIPAWRGTEYEVITIRHIMDMVTGLQFDFLADNLWTLAPGDMTKESVETPIAVPPDTEYNYSNHDVQLLDEIIENATGRDPEDYAKEYLFEPLGFAPEAHMEHDGAGNTIMFMGVHASCRDFARLGYLWLHRGVWDGKVIISPEYIDQATNPSSSVNAGHSHYWWLNGVTPYINSEKTNEGKYDIMMFPFAPHDLYAALGLGQNFVDVIPSLNSVFVHNRPAPHDGFAGFLNPQKLIDALLNDAELREHSEVLKLLLAAYE